MSLQTGLLSYRHTSEAIGNIRCNITFFTDSFPRAVSTLIYSDILCIIRCLHSKSAIM